MTNDLQALEQRLLRAFREQLRHYDRALAIVEPQGHGAADPGWVLNLNAVLREVEMADTAMTADKTAWRRAGQIPGTELKTLVDCLADRLRTLAEFIQRHVADIQARKEQLLPEVDGFIQQRRMLEAYGKYGDRQTDVA
jgi:hypothetical protein